MLHLSGLIRSLEWAEGGLSVLEIAFGARSLRKVVDFVIKTTTSFSSSLRSVIWIGQIRTESTKGASWWWEGPAALSYLWFLYGHPKLALRLIRLFAGDPFNWNLTPLSNSQLYLVLLPLLLTTVSAGFLFLMWFFDVWELSDMIPTRSEVPKGKKYWHYTKRRIQRKCIHLEQYRSSGMFSAQPRSQQEETGWLRRFLIRSVFEIVGFIMLWPSLVYLTLSAVAVWAIGRLLFAVSLSLGLAGKLHDYLHFRLPILGPILFLLTHFVSEYFGQR